MTAARGGGSAGDVAVVGTGFVGGTLGRALARAGRRVLFGSRHPAEDGVAEDTGAGVTTLAGALASADVVILAIPASAVGDLAGRFGDALAGKLVVDATNRMGQATSNSRSVLPDTVRYARAFNTLGGENMADPVFPDGRADLFFSAPEGDRGTVEAIVEDVGLRPVYLGADKEELVDALFRLWVTLAVEQGRGRRLAFRLLEG
jgi:8-hydroxy-5-deazaflavin:NADPH oxidoreductase